MPTKKSHYTGKSGQLAVMAEFALRGYNVAMPEMDIGDDIFVVDDERGHMWRIQVKTSVLKKQKKSSSGQFWIKEEAITEAVQPPLFFVFVMRMDNKWRFLIMDRAILADRVRADRIGTRTTVGRFNGRMFYISVRHDERVLCSKIELTHHMEDWGAWPELT